MLGREVGYLGEGVIVVGWVRFVEGEGDDKKDFWPVVVVFAEVVSWFGGCRLLWFFGQGMGMGHRRWVGVVV